MWLDLTDRVKQLPGAGPWSPERNDSTDQISLFYWGNAVPIVFQLFTALTTFGLTLALCFC